MEKRRSSFYGPRLRIAVVIAIVALASIGATRVHPRDPVQSRMIGSTALHLNKTKANPFLRPVSRWESPTALRMEMAPMRRGL